MGKVNLKWEVVQEKDRHYFIGLLNTLGLVKLPRMAQYCRNNWVVSELIFCKEIMSRDILQHKVLVVFTSRRGEKR